MTSPSGGTSGMAVAIGKTGSTIAMTIEAQGTKLASSRECERLMRLP